MQFAQVQLVGIIIMSMFQVAFVYFCNYVVSPCLILSRAKNGSIKNWPIFKMTMLTSLVYSRYFCSSLQVSIRKSQVQDIVYHSRPAFQILDRLK